MSDRPYFTRVSCKSNPLSLVHSSCPCPAGEEALLSINAQMPALHGYGEICNLLGPGLSFGFFS